MSNTHEENKIEIQRHPIENKSRLDWKKWGLILGIIACGVAAVGFVCFKIWSKIPPKIPCSIEKSTVPVSDLPPLQRKAIEDWKNIQLNPPSKKQGMNVFEWNPISGPGPETDKGQVLLDVQVEWRKIYANSPKTYFQDCQLVLQENPNHLSWRVVQAGSINCEQENVCNYGVGQ
jgi:hypothetical protein